MLLTEHWTMNEEGRWFEAENGGRTLAMQMIITCIEVAWKMAVGAQRPERSNTRDCAALLRHLFIEYMFMGYTWTRQRLCMRGNGCTHNSAQHLNTNQSQAMQRGSSAGGDINPWRPSIRVCSGRSFRSGDSLFHPHRSTSSQLHRPLHARITSPRKTPVTPTRRPAMEPFQLDIRLDHSAQVCDVCRAVVVSSVVVSPCTNTEKEDRLVFAALLAPIW